MAGSQCHILICVILGAAATGGKTFSQLLSHEEIQEESATGREILNLYGVKADDVTNSIDSSGLDTLQGTGQAEEYEVDKEVEVHEFSLNKSTSNETERHRRSTRATAEDKFSEYVNWWSGTSQAKRAVCNNPPEKSKVKELHIYDCCYFGKGWKIEQTVGKQVWDDIVTSNTTDRTILKFEHDNHGTTEDEFTVSREIDWVITEKTLTQKWHVDVSLKGAIGVFWDPDRKWFKNRNPPICGHYDYAIRVYELADGINWHQRGADLWFRRDGFFRGSKAISSKLIRRECDVNKPQDCSTRARTSNVVYKAAIEGDIEVLPAKAGA